MVTKLQHKIIPSERAALGTLISIAALSVMVYALFFVRPFSLITYADRTLLDLYKLSKDLPADAWGPRWWLIVGFTLQAILYWLGWRLTQQVHGRNAWIAVLAGSLGSLIVLLWMYPIGAADIFDNIFHGRIWGIYAKSPFAWVIDNFPDDPFFYYTAWRKFPSAYGPLWEMMTALLARLAGDGFYANVFAFKLFNLLFFAVAIAAVADILRQIAPERALAGTLLLAWNPLILYETFANGHNDIAMSVWIVVAVWLLLKSGEVGETRRGGDQERGRGGEEGQAQFAIRNSQFAILAILALVIGMLIKFIPVLLIPVVGLIILRRLPDWRSRIWFVVVTVGLSLLLIAIAYYPVWQGLETLGLTRRQRLLTASLPTIAYSLLHTSFGNDVVFMISRSAALATGFFALWQAWRASTPPQPSPEKGEGADVGNTGVLGMSDNNAPFRFREGGQGVRSDVESFARASFTILIFYLLFACPWFESWYAIWPLTIAALLPPGHAARLAALFGLVVVGKRLLIEPIWLWTWPLPPRDWRELRLSLAMLIIPWTYLLFALFDGLWKQSQKMRNDTH